MGQRTDSKMNRAFRIAGQYGHGFLEDIADVVGISRHHAGRIAAGKDTLPETVHMGDLRERLVAIVDYVSAPTGRALINTLD